MKKIAIDARFWRSETGGLGRYTRNLVIELLKIDTANHYTILITPEDEKEFQLTAPNLEKVVLPIGHFSYSEQTKLLKYLRSKKFDLVHFANFNHPIFYRGASVVTIHDMIMHLFPGQFQRSSVIHTLAYKRVFNDCKRAKRVIVPSQSTKNDLVEKLGFPKQKIAVTEEGAEARFKPLSSIEKQAARRRLKLPERYLLFVSRWEAYKGLPALLEAYELLQKNDPNLGLVICGRPDKQNPDVAAQVEAAKKRLLYIVTPGFVSDEDLADIYGAASVYVHPSWYEGFGIMILEAFSAGVPVVTSNVSSLPEVAGNAALLVDPHSSTEIAAAVKKILSDKSLAAEMIKKGFERTKHYSWAKMAKQTLAIYQEALANK